MIITNGEEWNEAKHGKVRGPEILLENSFNINLLFLEQKDNTN